MRFARAWDSPVHLAKGTYIMKQAVLLALGLTFFAGAAQAANPVVVIDTSLGKIKVELFEDKSPATVKNFLSYVDDKFYDNTIFHRVIGKENSGNDFMIQGGGFENYTEKKTKDPIKNEAGNGVSNKRGTLAMARTNDPDSATAQFFINVKDNDFLDRSARGAGYAVFGKVIDGMDVVDKIKAVRTGTKVFTPKIGPKSPFQDVPVEDVVIKSIKRDK
jgi:cyclophilin family peptidyl-prolyl cis-trans isomerase